MSKVKFITTISRLYGNLDVMIEKLQEAKYTYSKDFSSLNVITWSDSDGKVFWELWGVPKT